MKMKKLVAVSAMLSGLAGFAVPAAHAEVAASVGAANMYYWRGADLGLGDAQIWGDLKYTESGFYTGIWGGSGDIVSGTEYDIYAGYGGAMGDFKYDLSAWTYAYPTGENALQPGDLSEAVLMLGYGPVALTYYKNIAGAPEYSYVTLAATFGQFTIKYGAHDGMVANAAGTADSPTHLDITYAFNDKVSFTLGKVLDNGEFKGEEGDVFAWNDEVKFVVGVALPIQ